jgi:DNA-binding MarR family transcriptional regulator
MSASSRPYPLRISLGFLVHDVARMRRTRMDAALRPLGLTRSQRWMLIQLSQFGEGGVAQIRLADAMHVGPVSLGEKLLLLEQMGYVTRVRDDSDRRQKTVRLTPEGYAALEQSTRFAQDFNQAVAEGISPDEIAVAERVLAAMRRNLMKLGADEEE